MIVARRVRITAALWLVTVLAPALVAHAQRVRGTVVRPTDGAGLPGVVVLLLDDAGSVAGRALTNERGEYRIVAPAAGTYRERTLRIGYRPLTSEAYSLAAGEEIVRRISLVAVPFTLDTLRVVNASGCSVKADTATATFAIWEQVRAALTATQLSSGDRAYAARVVTYERTLEADGRRVREQHSSLSRNYTARPWRAQSAQELHALGYVRDESDGTTIYLAPDIDVLLSDGFLDDHCFRIAQSDDRARIGLSFEPSRDRKSLPEVRGTLWVNRLSSELDVLDFRFANVSREQEDAEAGGHLAFARMSNGAWAITRWNIRMPVLERRETGGFGVARGSELRLAEIKVSGGELALVLRGRDTLWSRTPLVLVGTAVDSATGAPIGDARISVVGTTLHSASDPTGHFAIAGMLPGTYMLEVRTSSLDAIGAVAQRELTFTDTAEPMRVGVPTAGQVAQSACSARPGAEPGIITGTASLRGDSTPAPMLPVFAEWTDAGAGMVAAEGKPSRSTVGHTDARGRFWLCGVPLAKTVVVRVANDSLSAEPATIRIAEGIVARVDLSLDHGSDLAAVFTGIVVADSTNEPVANVEVSLSDIGLVERTNARGTFRFNRVTPGNHTVVARRVGYSPLETSLAFAARAVVDKRIVLIHVTALDSVRVIATREKLGGGLAAFDERRRLGFGKFITPDVMRANEHRKVQDLLTAFAGIKVMSRNECRALGDVCKQLSPTARYVASTRISHIGPCFLDVILDGARIAKGGNADWETAYDLDMLPVSGLEAVELYRSSAEVPTLYGGPSAQCGVLLLWSRVSGGS